MIKMKQIDRRNLNKFIISENETMRSLKKIDEKLWDHIDRKF